MTPIRLLFLAIMALVSAEEKLCMTHCKPNGCALLNGNVYNECGACDDVYKCNPTSTDFTKKEQ